MTEQQRELGLIKDYLNEHLDPIVAEVQTRYGHNPAILEVALRRYTRHVFHWSQDRIEGTIEQGPDVGGTAGTPGGAGASGRAGGQGGSCGRAEGPGGLGHGRRAGDGAAAGSAADWTRWLCTRCLSRTRQVAQHGEG